MSHESQVTRYGSRVTSHKSGVTGPETRDPRPATRDERRGTRDPRRGFFVTGTDTGVGKTLVACALLKAYAARGAHAVGMKPVASGAARGAQGLINEDVERLMA